MKNLRSASEIPKFIWGGNYTVDVDWGIIEAWIEDKKEHNIDLDPDFQRAHVWMVDKQIKYVEFVMRGGTSSREIFWNCAGWMNDFRGPMLLVDGKQRLEAARSFLRNEIPAFGSYLNEWEDGIIRKLRLSFKFTVNNLSSRAEVLQWYLDLNSGGVIHTEEELEKVRILLEQEKIQN